MRFYWAKLFLVWVRMGDWSLGQTWTLWYSPIYRFLPPPLIKFEQIEAPLLLARREAVGSIYWLGGKLSEAEPSEIVN